jgi:hypothetical protein
MDGETPSGEKWMNELRKSLLEGKELTSDQKDYLDLVGLTHSFDKNEKLEQQRADAALVAKKDAA